MVVGPFGLESLSDRENLQEVSDTVNRVGEENLREKKDGAPSRVDSWQTSCQAQDDKTLPDRPESEFSLLTRDRARRTTSFQFLRSASQGEGKARAHQDVFE